MAPVAFFESTDSYSATTATGAIQCFRGRMFVEARRNKLFVLIQYICVLRMSWKPLKKSVKLKLLFTMNTRRKLR